MYVLYHIHIYVSRWNHEALIYTCIYVHIYVYGMGVVLYCLSIYAFKVFFLLNYYTQCNGVYVFN